MSIRQAIAAELRRMDDPVWVEDHPWETISDAGKYRYLREVDRLIAAITEAGYEIVASLPAWAILPTETLIERMGGRSLDPLPEGEE